MSVSLYVWQRPTAAVMAPMVAAHIAVIFYATRHGMAGADILARTRGTIGWAAFDALFVAAASINAAIGLRNILAEWSPLDDCRAGIAASVLECRKKMAQVPAPQWIRT